MFLYLDHLLPICCDLLDHIADFLMPPDDDYDNDERQHTMNCATINSGIWGNSLPYQIILNIQQVNTILSIGIT